jgi:hypothetical protein
VHAALYRSYPAGFTDVVASAATTGTVVRRVGPGFDMATGLGTPRWDVLAGTLFAPAPPPPAAPSLTTPATTVTDRARLHASAPAGVSAVRWYVSAGQDPACTGLGTQGPPADVTVREGQQQVWLRYVDQTLTCSTATTVPVTAPVDDLHVRLSAGWKRSGAQRAYHRTVAASARAGALASYTGRGSSFGAVLVTGHGGGIVQLVLDGRVARTFDTGVGPRRFGVLLSTRARHRGRHTVAVRVLGLAGRGGAATVTVDGFLVAP